MFGPTALGSTRPSQHHLITLNEKKKKKERKKEGNYAHHYGVNAVCLNRRRLHDYLLELWVPR